MRNANAGVREMARTSRWDIGNSPVTSGDYMAMSVGTGTALARFIGQLLVTT